MYQIDEVFDTNTLTSLANDAEARLGDPIFGKSVSSLRNWRTNLQPLKVRWPWLSVAVGLHRTLMITPPSFFMVFRRRRLWLFNNRAILVDSRPQLLVWFFSNLAILIICRTQLPVSITTTLLLHTNTVFLYEKHFSYKWKPNSQIFAVTYKYSLRFSRSGDKIQHPMHMQED